MKIVTLSRRTLLIAAAIVATGLVLARSGAAQNVSAGASQQTTSVPIQAPANPLFLKYLDARQHGLAASSTTADGHSLGWLPEPVDLSHLTTQQGPFLDQTIPSTYDLRTTGKITAVRNQGSCGSCWTFGTYGSMESILAPGETRDFSENNLKNLHGFDWSPCSGGNGNMSMAYLGRWAGPVDESADPYQATDTNTSPPGLLPQKHVQDIIIISGRGSATNNDGLKSAVMTYGALQTSMYWDDPSYRSATVSYYYNGSSSSTNHSVTLVGWDDAYSRYNFAATPPGDGAFLIKNSWGTSWGQSGYFWISYYDLNYAMSSSSYAYVGNETATNYSRQYSYDPLGWVGSWGYGSATAWFANVFTAVATEQLKAVSTYVASNNSPYQISIYTGVTSSPTSGTLAGTTTGTFSTAGYHTVTLSSPVSLTNGGKFSVVVQLTTPGDNYPIPAEEAASGYSSGATASAGQSYISNTGTSWQDTTTVLSTLNVCIKAFTGTANNPAPSISSLSPSSATAGGTAFTLTVNGSGFIGTSSVQWGGSSRITTYVNSTQLQAAISAADISSAGTVQVTVFNPSPGGGTSGNSPFTINPANNPLPSISSLSPSSATAGGTAFTLTVNGSGFIGTSSVRWGGSSRTTTYVNSTQLQAAISAADISSASTVQVTVFNPSPGGGTSGNSPFTINPANNPAPSINSLSPSSATAGGTAFTLTVNGSGFIGTSSVRWGGSSRTTTYVNSTQLQAAISASDISSASTVQVTVFNPSPGGGTSGNSPFTINPAGSARQFIPVTPCRILDTRNANGTFGGPFIGANSTRTLPIPSSSCGIPSTAQAYSLNITVVPRTGSLAFLTVWPAGQTQPGVSTLNSWDGSVIANAAIVPAGASGSINVYATNDTDVVIDINGYFASPGTLAFYPLTPCRAIDTRNANGTFGGPFLTGGASRAFPLQSSSCGIPAAAQAYSLNVTVVPKGTLWYLTAWPTGQPQPNASTLNSYDGTTLANAAIVPAGTSNGSVSFYASQNTDLVVDVNGYFAPPGTGGLNFYAAPPCRIADTRNANGTFGGPILATGETRSFPIPSSACGLPASAQAYSLNMTVVPPGSLWFLALWPAGQSWSGISTLNDYKGLAVANAALVPAGTSGAVNVYVSNSSHVIIDTNGYFAP